jgi:hypothetical protein
MAVEDSYFFLGQLSPFLGFCFLSSTGHEKGAFEFFHQYYSAQSSHPAGQNLPVQQGNRSRRFFTFPFIFARFEKDFRGYHIIPIPLVFERYDR